MELWQLPSRVRLGDKDYPFCTDYRQILSLMGILEDPLLPEAVRWHMALLKFYSAVIPREQERPAMEYLCRFVAGGQEPGKAGEKLLDWQLDAPAIIADINALTGREIRQEKYLHWWTFLSFFHSIGQGQLGTLVQLRRKLRRGEKLEPWERQFYREHKDWVDLRRPLNKEELEEKQRLSALLGR